MGKSEYVVNFFTFLAQQVREYLSEIGVHKLKDIIGHAELIEATVPVGSPTGRTLRIDGLQPLCIRAWDYGEEDLEGARHPQDIQRGRFVNLNIDLNIHGVGGADTWGKRTLPQYTIDGNKPHHMAFILSVVTKTKD